MDTNDLAEMFDRARELSAAATKAGNSAWSLKTDPDNPAKQAEFIEELRKLYLQLRLWRPAQDPDTERKIQAGRNLAAKVNSSGRRATILALVEIAEQR